jgi:RNA polymerase sigma factor (sigma-70 family)
VVQPAHPWLERLIAEHYAPLVAFIGRRTRSRANVADIAQETYLRLLRAPNPETIRSPEAYLYTIARHIVREQAVLDGRADLSIEAEAAEFVGLLCVEPADGADADLLLRRERLKAVLAQLPAKCRATLVLQYQYDWSYREIADHLGISTHMVKKYLAQGLAHCRRRMARWE